MRDNRIDLIYDLMSELNNVSCIDMEQCLYETDSLYIRFSLQEDEMEFAPKKNFDRWANSTALSIIPIPYTIQELSDAINSASRKDNE